MKRLYRVFREMQPLLTEEFGEPLCRRVLPAAQTEWEKLCTESAQEPKAARKITGSDAYPCIALYRVLQREGIRKDTALAFLDRSWSRRSEKKAQSMRSMMKLPGLYKTMPALFRWVAMHQFGEEAGFRARYYPTGRTKVKFDMTQCLYCDVCRKNGCPELVPCFCHTDDVCNGHIHPRLCWNRTKIMGDGGDVCDFDLFVTEKPRGKA